MILQVNNELIIKILVEFDKQVHVTFLHQNYQENFIHESTYFYLDISQNCLLYNTESKSLNYKNLVKHN